MAHNCGRAGAAGRARARSRPANHLYYSMTSLLSRLRHHLSRTRLLAEPGTAVLAVSGGADSVALLDLLHALAPELGLKLVVAHVDRSEEHTSELQSLAYLVCRLLLEKKKTRRGTSRFPSGDRSSGYNMRGCMYQWDV